MKIPEALYFECHITIDPVFDQRLDVFKSICKQFKFNVAKLIMVKGGPSKKDSFCTGRSKTFIDIYDRMNSLVIRLQNEKFVVRRYKIEIAVIDVRITHPPITVTKNPIKA